MRKKDFGPWFWKAVALVVLSVLFWPQGVQAKLGEDDALLGPHSKQARGELRVLMAAVRFPDVEPKSPLERTRKRVVDALNHYVREQSYDLAWVKADFRGWIDLPDPITRYNVSPYNFKVDRTRVKKLIEDTMTAIENQVDFSRYQHMLIIPGAFTTPGKGYGMICYCANPGMLTGVRRKADFVTLKSKGGKEFNGGIFVGTENAHLGMFAHDFFHALGGIYDSKRLVPCLYDFERQSDASKPPSPENHAIYMGPWDIMSEHFIKRDAPSPGLSSFTKIRLGWIDPDQVSLIKPGETAFTFLSPLSRKGDKLVVKIPVSERSYYLVENRQPIGYDRILPDSGLLILKVTPWEEEGSGTVKIMNADPNVPHFARATFKLDKNNRNLFLDKDNQIAVIPLWHEEGKQGVLITTPEKSAMALKAAQKVQQHLTGLSEPKSTEDRRRLEETVSSFKTFDFKKCLQAGNPD